MSKNKINNSSNEIRLAKKAAVLNQRRKSRMPWIVLGGLAVVMAAAAAVFTFGIFVENESSSTSTPAIDSQSLHITHAVSLFEDGVARHYQYSAGPHTIHYFILKSSDGVIRAAFDACDVCWPSGKGYTQQGDQMICRNCGRRFDSVRINEVKGGCNPAPLKRLVEGDRLIIQKSDILEGIRYFNFSDKVAS